MCAPSTDGSCLRTPFGTRVQSSAPPTIISRPDISLRRSIAVVRGKLIRSSAAT
ncbi:unnamed protein product, partial [Trichogramma brassicae]